MTCTCDIMVNALTYARTRHVDSTLVERSFSIPPPEEEEKEEEEEGSDRRSSAYSQ
jgi:hypothetical protein